MPTPSPTKPSSDGVYADTCVVTILHGVLLDSVPEISAALAVSSLVELASVQRSATRLCELHSYFVQASGISARAKLECLDGSVAAGLRIANHERVLQRYEALRAEVTSSMAPLGGISDLLNRLSAAGVLTFASSVVAQDALNSFVEHSLAGRAIGGAVREWLGERQDGFRKLEGHLRHILKAYPPIARFYVLVDAQSEVEMARILPPDIGRRVAGFVQPLDADRLIAALRRAGAAWDEGEGRASGDLISYLVGESGGQPSAVSSSAELPTDGGRTLSEAGADVVFSYAGAASLGLLEADVLRFARHSSRPFT